jgi:hypothetical protein
VCAALSSPSSADEQGGDSQPVRRHQTKPLSD